MCLFIIFNVFICLWGRLLNWFFFYQMWVNHNETLDTSITGETPTNIFKSLCHDIRIRNFSNPTGNNASEISTLR
jgi:hypothetical protein